MVLKAAERFSRRRRDTFVIRLRDKHECATELFQWNDVYTKNTGEDYLVCWKQGNWRLKSTERWGRTQQRRQTWQCWNQARRLCTHYIAALTASWTGHEKARRTARDIQRNVQCPTWHSPASHPMSYGNNRPHPWVMGPRNPNTFDGRSSLATDWSYCCKFPDFSRVRE